MILRAAAAGPADDAGRAAVELREQLRVISVAARATPEWSTLQVAGPVEVPGADLGARFEWTATVVAWGPASGRPFIHRPIRRIVPPRADHGGRRP